MRARISAFWQTEARREFNNKFVTGISKQKGALNVAHKDGLICGMLSCSAQFAKNRGKGKKLRRNVGTNFFSPPRFLSPPPSVFSAPFSRTHFGLGSGGGAYYTGVLHRSANLGGGRFLRKRNAPHTEIPRKTERQKKRRGLFCGKGEEKRKRVRVF